MALLTFGYNLNAVERFTQHVKLFDISDKEGIRSAIKEVKTIRKKKKNPPLVEFSEGWSPSNAQKFLAEHDLKTEDYHRTPWSWIANSPFKEIQKNGLPTPLLDWSESFYIAVFFAFSEDIPSNVDNVAVWAIQTATSEVMDKFNENIMSKVGGDTQQFFPMKFVDPYTDVNSRLISQSGIFLQKPSEVDIEDLISKACKENSHSPLLVKITVPASERENVLNNLFAMNINWSTILPGIEGAAQHVKMKMQLLDLKVRRMGREGVIKHSQKNIFNSSSDK